MPQEIRLHCNGVRYVKELIAVAGGGVIASLLSYMNILNIVLGPIHHLTLIPDDYIGL